MASTIDQFNDPVNIALDEPLRRIFRIVLTYASCMLSVMLYDWIISLKKEYRYIWKQKFTVVSALYVGLRYFEMIRCCTTIYLANTLVPVEKCPPWGRWQVFGAISYAAMTYALFTLRAVAIYGNSKIVMAFLVSLASTILILQGIASSEFGTIPWARGAGPCFAGKTPVSSNILVIFWLGPFVFDIVTTILLVARVVVIRRRGGSDSSIVRLLARDGLLYFFIISAANLINVGFYLGAPADIQSMNSAMPYDVASVMCSRLILSLRHHAHKEELTTASNHGYNMNKSQGVSVITKSRSPNAMDADYAEKGGAYQSNGLQAHIALATLNNTHSKGGDEESLDEVRPQTMEGVFVVTETKTAVDEGRNFPYSSRS